MASIIRYLILISKMTEPDTLEDWIIQRNQIHGWNEISVERMKFIAVSVKVERLPVSNGDSNVVHNLGIDRIELRDKLSFIFIPAHENVW